MVLYRQSLLKKVYVFLIHCKNPFYEKRRVIKKV